MTLANFVKTLIGGPRIDSLHEARRHTWAAWLAPIPGEHAHGRDPGYEDAFFELKDEATKLSGIDDGLITRACEQLLKETGKDLRLVGYYAFARLRQDGLAGFADGLELAASLVDRFGETLLPARAEAKRAALEMLSTARMIETLDSRGDFAPADLERAIAALDVLVAHTGTWSDAARPNLHPLVARFGNKDEPVRNVSPDLAMQQLPASPLVSSGSVASARDLLDHARAMSAWLRDQENGYLPSVRIARSVRWDTLHDVPPSDVASHTRLTPPRAELRQQLKRLVLQKQWHELLERVEGAFMEGVNHLWFDLQYFQHVALDHVGAPYHAWSEVLRTDFALFLARLPGIERLSFSDGTPFSDDTTLEWIARHAVVRDLEAGETVAPLPVSADGEGDAGDWPEIEAQARELVARDGVEAAFAWLDALPGMKTERHRFLQRLVMARLADHAGRPDTALALLVELDTSSRSLPVMRWEPALAFEVKQQLVRALKATSNRKDADKPTLARRIGELQAELTVLDPARALTLS
ncbi:type VI secretion system protein TssA [Burkholderia cenocepacia]|uniref:type VI secretion system protein TssA n=1 Tax=Burkholderia cenocepacia TaxID=95486 RepID=UPI002B24A863|nr:type VI secretion system protein TssA [Burkholderia cenocepacia]MEB2608761.1 type VI secretion system protein TssA [Burkholderia cenocepacia]